MDAKEFQIGDWYANSDNDYCRVIRNFGKEVWGEGDNVSDSTDDPQPIPLTSEILTKNGFKIDGEYSECIADGLFVNVLIWAYEAEDIYISWDDNDNALSIAYNLGKPCDEIKLIEPKVHEMQHALRLCGLTELANNFKV